MPRSIVLTLAVALPIATLVRAQDGLLTAADRGGSLELALFDGAGGKPRWLTNHRVLPEDFAWSPDGRSVLFAAGSEDGGERLFVATIDGSSLQRISPADVADTEPAWSPDGKRIACTSAGGLLFAIHVMNADGTARRRLTKLDACECRAAWSPDGRQIAFDAFLFGERTDVYVANADGSGLRRLTDDPQHDMWPIWSPDGRRIAFTSTRGGDNQLYVMNADGSGVRQLSQGLGTCTGRFAWSPDSRQIVYTHAAVNTCRVRLVDVERGSIVAGLTPLQGGYDRYPSFAPDGRRVACISGENGREQLAVINLRDQSRRVLGPALGANAALWKPAVLEPDESNVADAASSDGTATTVRRVASAPVAPQGLQASGAAYDVRGGSQGGIVRLPLDPALANDPSKSVYVGHHDGQSWDVVPAEIVRGRAIARVKHFSVFTVFFGARRESPSAAELATLRIGAPEVIGIRLRGAEAEAILDVSACRTASDGGWNRGVAVKGWKVCVAKPSGKLPGPRDQDLAPLRYAGADEDVVLDATQPGRPTIDLEFDPNAELKLANAQATSIESAPNWRIALRPIFEGDVEGALSPSTMLYASAAEACVKLHAGVRARLSGALREQFDAMTEEHPFYLVWNVAVIKELYANPRESARHAFFTALFGGRGERFISLLPSSEFGRVVSHEWGHYVVNQLYGDEAFFRFPGGSHQGYVEASSRELAFSEDLATFFGQWGAGAGFPEKAGAMAGRWRDHASHPEDFEDSLAQLWPKRRDMDVSRIEAIAATVLSSLAERCGFERVYGVLAAAKPTNVLEFAQAWIRAVPANDPAVSLLQDACVANSLTWRVRGRVVGPPDEDGKPTPLPQTRAAFHIDFGNGSTFEQESFSDADGRFELWVPPGKLRYVLSRPGWRERERNTFEIATDGPTGSAPQTMPDFVMVPATQQILCVQRGERGTTIHRAETDGSNDVALGTIPKDFELEGWSPARDEVVLSRRLDKSGRDLARMPVNGGEPTWLTHIAEDESYPAWSPTGREIAFVWCKGNLDGDDDRAAAAVLSFGEEVNVKYLSRSGDRNRQVQPWRPTWSPNATYLAFAKSNGVYVDEANDDIPYQYDIYTMKPDGSEVRELTSTPYYDRSPVWSPDGTKIAFVSNGGAKYPQVFVMNTSGGAVQCLSSFKHWFQDDYPLAWSPDGRSIAVFGGGLRAFDVAPPRERLLRSWDDSEGVVLTRRYLDGPQWSPDGKQILFVLGQRSDGFAPWVWVIDADGGNAHPVMRGEAPAWIAPQLSSG